MLPKSTRSVSKRRGLAAQGLGGRRRWLYSNMEPLDQPFVYQGLVWRTVEHFYQAMKLRRDDLEGRRRVAEMASPFDSKRACNTRRLAEEGRLRPDWDAVRLAVMEFALRRKFAPGTSWARRLVEERGEIVERNTWGDLFFGVDVITGKGANHLGLILMKLREELRCGPLSGEMVGMEENRVMDRDQRQADATPATKVACVGHRGVGESWKRTLGGIGRTMAHRGIVVVSGNAPGSDQAYAAGVNAVNPELLELSLPWRGYERSAIVQGNVVRPCEDGRYFQVAEEHHPAWGALSSGVKRLMARNVAVVEGALLVIALPNHSRAGSGGTGHTMRVAGAMGIPIVDLTTTGADDALARVLEQLDKLGIGQKASGAAPSIPRFA